MGIYIRALELLTDTVTDIYCALVGSESDELETVLADDKDRAVAMEVALEDIRNEDVEQQWLNAKDGRLGLPDHFDCSTDAFDRR